MNNWRLLLLAFVAVFQPIASFTERGLVDGRQRCDQRTSFLRDSGLNFHGSYRFTKPVVLERRSNQREEVRDTRLNAVREDSLRTSASPGRQIRDTLERGSSSPTRLGRFSQTEYRLTRDAFLLGRETRAAQLRTNYRDERNREFGRDRQLSSFGARRSNLPEDDDRSRRNIYSRSNQFRVSMESRRATRESRDNVDVQRVQEIRETRITSDEASRDVTDFNRNSRRLMNERAQRMDMRRSESRIQQLNRNADREILGRRFRDNVFRSSSNEKENRVYDNESTRMVRRDAQSIDRNERRSIESRRTRDGPLQQRDIQENHVLKRNTVLEERRNTREASDRIYNVRTLQSDRSSESRQELRQRDTRLSARGQMVDNLRESQRTENNRITRASRSTGNRESQNYRRDYQIIGRERSLENGRDVRDTRNMNRVSRSLDRTVENRKDSRISNREIQNTARESRENMMFNRATESSRGRATDIRRQSNSLNRERSTERRSIREDERTGRMSPVARNTESQRLGQNVERDIRTLESDRFADSRRDVRKEDRASAVLGRDRIVSRRSSSRMNPRDVRDFDSQRSFQQRNSRTVRLEDSNRRNARNEERLSRSLDGTGRFAREYSRNDRSLGQRQYSEARENPIHARATSRENRQDIRKLERIERIRAIQTRRAASGSEEGFRSSRRERSVEDRRDIRNVANELKSFTSERVEENRRVRTAEGRRTQNTERDSRTFRSEGERRVDSRIGNVHRSRENLSMDRNGHRTIEHQDMRNTLFDNRRSRSLQTRRISERNSMDNERREAESLNRFNLEFARKREFQGINQNPTQAEYETPTTNWQYLFYTLQGLYICGVLTQLLNEKNAGKKTRVTSWWPVPQRLIKVD